MPKLEENFDADQEHSVILTFMFEMFMNVVFSERVFDVVDFLLIFPFFIQLMNLTGHVPLFPQIEGAMNFTEATFSDQCQQEIAFMKNIILIESRMIFVVQTLQFSDVNIAFAIESF